MTAPHIVDPECLPGEALSGLSRPDTQPAADGDHSLLSIEANAVCGAEYDQTNVERRAQRNGYRYRDLDTRVDTIDVIVPKLRTDSYLPDWSLECHKRARSALITAVANTYLAGVSAWHMDELIGTLGISSPSGVTGLTYGG